VRQEFLEVTGTVSALILPPQRQDSRLAAAASHMLEESPLLGSFQIHDAGSVHQ